MTCTACGDKPKKSSKDFTKAVIEIDNPEQLVLLRKVVIPASMGDDEDVPAVVGKYRNVVLYYEANKHTYLYSSDGIPTFIETEVPKEVLDRIDTLETDVDNLEEGLAKEVEDRANADDAIEQEIQDLKNSPDVVDIVGTYAELEAYDTSKLGDQDIIRVLVDETQDDASTYYRWQAGTQTWELIGVVGPYYTKGETDELLGTKQDTLTAGSNISIDGSIISATDTTYSNFVGTNGSSAGSAGLVPAPAAADANKVLSSDGHWETNVSANDATLTIKRNNTSLGTFTSNAYDDVEVDIEVPTKTSDLTNDGSDGTSTYAETGDLATVATSGNYSDLTNKPTIGNATLTITQNSSSVGTFTANATTNKSIDIATPTKTSDLTNDGSDGTSTYAEASSLSAVATSGNYSDLTNTPTIGDATLTIKQNNTSLGTFTANATTNASVNITTPTKTSDLTNDGSNGSSTYVEASGLSTVATSGSYTDLTNKPTIGDATLTIQKNGVDVQTFTANATSNKTANIAVPTKTSDLTNDGADGTSTYVEASALPTVDTAYNASSSNAIANSTVTGSLNRNVMTDMTLDATPSTTTVQLNNAKVNLSNPSSTTTTSVALPVASTTQAGIMNSATFDAVTNNTSNINALINGAVAITGLSANPSQSDLTTAWQTETGITTLMNRASVYDVTNNKVWTYYANDATWHAASNSTQVTVNTFTNSSEGTIKGSTNTGQIFAENDGTGSVNGWDALTTTVGDHTSKLSTIAQGAEVNVQSDWTQTNTTADDYIKNKPSNLVQDANYVHTDNNFTNAEKTKLDGVAAGAQVNQDAFSNIKVGSTTVAADTATDTLELAAGSNVTLTPDATNDKVTIAATDTTYSDATTTTSGLMSSADKIKLNGIATGAEVNQNAFSNVKVGNITVESDSKTDTLELVAGSNVTLTPDATNDKVTIAATDTTYSNATTSAAGLMSSSDKTKLNGIATGAQVNQDAFSDIKVGNTTISADSATDTLEFIAGNNVTLTPDDTNDTVTIAATDTTYNNATTSAAGLMSAADKTKLDGIATGAQVNQNAFSNVKVGSTTVAADSKTDTLELVAGNNITLTPDATNDKVTVTGKEQIKTLDNLSPTDDTVAAWKTLFADTTATGVDKTEGYFVTRYSVANKFANQPSTYGFLETVVVGNDMYQRWKVQNYGAVLYRSGNGGSSWTDPGNGKFRQFNLGNSASYYATSTTAADTAAKVASLDNALDATAFRLETGARVSVKFTNANTYNGTATLNVGGTGAKNITYEGTNTGANYMWRAGEVVDFVYDGTNWVMINGGIASTTYYGVTKLVNSVSSTSTSMAATPNSVKQAYDLASSKPDITMTDTDPGEGSPLTTNNYIGVYDDGAELVFIGDVLSSPTDTATMITRKVLYTSSAYSTVVSSITLSESVASYDALEITFNQKANAAGRQSTIPSELFGAFLLSLVRADSDNVGVFGAYCSASGTTLRLEAGGGVAFSSQSTPSGYTNDLETVITKVVGIKYS